MTSGDKLIAFVNELNSHYNPRKFKIFLEVTDGEVLSVKFRSLIHCRLMTREELNKVDNIIKSWSQGSMAIVHHADGVLDISVNPLSRGYTVKNVESTLNNLLKLLEIPKDF